MCYNVNGNHVTNNSCRRNTWATSNIRSRKRWWSKYRTMDDYCTSSLGILDYRYINSHHLLNNVSKLRLKTVHSAPSNFHLHCRCYKRRHSKFISQLEITNAPYITPSVDSTPSSNGSNSRSLKEEALEIDEKAILADQTDQPVFQSTAYCKY